MYTCGGCGLAGPTEDERNILDVYRHWHTECIRTILDSERNDLVIIVENISGDFNLSSVIRSANQFGCAEIWIVGRKRYDKRGAVCTHHYENIHYTAEIDEVVDVLHSRGYTVFAVDNVDGAVSTHDIDWPVKSALIFGEEQRGLSQESLDIADKKVYIQTKGSARSLNVASAASIMMYDYVSKVV